ncbi:MAG: carboxypeptidase-like regulatory domain-containing protein [Bacteroidetes bacterium]|nr:carboxypeptidase-like regulatory domain-containing protein [Bacteroidota bacterium]MBL6943818.1 carboxypeptidase-like regulatory domain-containing protein [Bacteroidales bacterium]
MLRNLLLTFGLFFATSVIMFAQQGALKGKVLDKDTKEPIPFANIVLENKGSQVGGATSDFDGNYMIKPIPPGKYDLKATFVGFKTVVIQGIIIGGDQIRFYDIELTSTVETLDVVEIVDYKVPLIDKDQTTSGATITAAEISKMPNRSANAVATTVGGVFSEDGERGSVRGARTDATAMYIDGIRVIGNSSVPQSAIEQVDVILGGVPARYGDVTSGIINVTTKGPARQFGAGFELETSQFLDAFGHNRVGVNMMGPLIKNKDKTSSLLGFFIAGDINSNLDGRPSSTGYFSLSDENLMLLEDSPVRPSGSGSGTFINGEFLRNSDLQHVNTAPNTARQSYNFIGNINIRTTETINLTLGGSYYYYNGRDYNYRATLANWDKNTLRNNTNYRGYVRFTQRFPTDAQSTSVFTNFYYSLQFDYTKDKGEFGDANHWDNLFEYGYIGKFSTYKTPTFEMGSDTVNGHYYQNVWVLNSWDYDTLVEWSPRDINPLVAKYTTDYYSIYEGMPVGHYQNVDDLLLGNAMINGSTPQSIYGLYQSPGTNQSGYGKWNNDQYNMRMDASLDIGNHGIKLGFQYEQRTNRFINYAPTGFWNLIRDGKGLTNFHLRELDKDHPELISYNGHVDTILYRRKYDANAQRTFDINLREAMGLPVNGLDYIVMDSYDYDNGTIEYYDKNGNMHTVNLAPGALNVGLFSPDELWNDGLSAINYAGFDYQGNVLTTQPAYEDFFNRTDANGVYTRDIGAYEPIYMAGYIQDQFAFKDLIFNIGVRVDRFDANQKVLEDPFLLYPAHTVSNINTETGFENVSHPSNMGGDFVVYVDKVKDPTKVVGYRNEYIWYNAEGIEILDPSILDVGNGISPALLNQDQSQVTINSFKDYDPQINVMPRISFSFPISDEALFFAHYDVLTQRPTSNSFSNPSSYYFFNNIGGSLNNPSLEPTKTIDYELGFTQKVSTTSSITFTTFYREMRSMIQMYRFNGAYPKDYTSFNNLDFGTVKGLTAEYDLRRTGNVRVRAAYTLQFADATGASTTTAASLLAAGLPNLRSTFPMPWDRRHAFNIVLDYRWGSGKTYNGPTINREKSGKAPMELLSNFGFSLTVNGGSGTPYTAARNVTSPLSGGTNLLQGTYSGSRLPWQFRLDLRVDKDFYFKLKKNEGDNAKGAYLNVYLQVLNLLDTKNIINVYPYTGNANDDGYLTAPEWQRQINNQLDPMAFRDLYGNFVDNPGNYSSPRQIRVGLMFNF